MRHACTLFVLALLAPALADAPAAAGEAPSRLKAFLERSATHTGPHGWDGHGVGTTLTFKLTHTSTGPQGKAVAMTSNSRVRLTQRQGDACWIERAMRSRKTGNVWKASPARRRAPAARSPAPTRVARGKAKVSVAGTEYACDEIAWVTTRGSATVDVMVLRVHPKHGVLEWISTEGNWTSRFTALRLAVPYKLGTRKLTCREFRRVSSASNFPMRMESTQLWCEEVPDFVVREKTVQKSAVGAATQTNEQVRELTAFEVPTQAKSTKAAPGKAAPGKAGPAK